MFSRFSASKAPINSWDIFFRKDANHILETQNAFIARFNGTFRREVLDMPECQLMPIQIAIRYLECLSKGELLEFIRYSFRYFP